MKWITKKFKNIDMISENVSLYHDQSTKYKNSIGSLLTLLVLLLGSAATIYFVKEVLGRKKPEITISEEFMTEPKIFLEDSNFYAFALYKVGAAVIEDHFNKFEYYMHYSISDGSHKENTLIDRRIELI